MAQDNRLMNLKSVQAISSTRQRVNDQAVGRSFIFTITGDGNVVDVKKKDGTLAESYLGGGQVFQKKIFNLNYVDDAAVQRMRPTLMDAIKAEKAGDTKKADELYRLWLNKTQLSFSLPLPSDMEHELGKGVEIAAKVQKVTTDNGSFLTIDPKTIRIQQAAVGASFKLDIDEPEDEEDEDTTSTPDLTSMDRTALKAFIKEQGLDIKVTKNMEDAAVREAIKAAITPKTVGNALDDDDDDDV